MIIRGYLRCRRENSWSKFETQGRVINETALEKEPPSFYISDRDLEHLEECRRTQPRVAIWDFGILRDHPRRTRDRRAADFHIVSILRKRDVVRTMLRRPRSIRRPYLCFSRANLDRHSFLLRLPTLKRVDVVFFAFDLGDCVLKTDGKFILSGVTIPSSNEYVGVEPDLKGHRKYLFSFKGNCEQLGYFGSSSARKALKMLATTDSQQRINFRYIDTTDPDVDQSTSGYMALLRDSTFALVPHGDGRWSHRLVEAIGAGAIPVIIADSLTLPYEQLINYRDLCVWIDERFVTDATSMDDIVEQLPQDWSTIERMRAGLRLANETCLKSFPMRVEMLLLAAQEHVAAKQGRTHRLGFACSHRAEVSREVTQERRSL